jgi:transposase
MQQPLTRFGVEKKAEKDNFRKIHGNFNLLAVNVNFLGVKKYMINYTRRPLL